jgi:hypothetical protein
MGLCRELAQSQLRMLQRITLRPKRGVTQAWRIRSKTRTRIARATLVATRPAVICSPRRSGITRTTVGTTGTSIASTFLAVTKFAAAQRCCGLRLDHAGSVVTAHRSHRLGNCLGWLCGYSIGRRLI